MMGGATAVGAAAAIAETGTGTAPPKMALPRPIPLLGAKSSVLLSVAITWPGGGANGEGGTTSIREWMLCGAPASRFPDGKNCCCCELNDEEADGPRYGEEKDERVRVGERICDPDADDE